MKDELHLGSRVRVLHLVNRFDRALGGSIAASMEIANTGHGEKVCCEVAGTIVPGEDSSEDYRKTYPNLKLHTFRGSFPGRFFASSDLCRWLRHAMASYDVVHCHQIFHFPFVYLRRLLRSGVPALVVTPHNSLDPDDLRKHALIKRLLYGPGIIRPVLSRTRVLHCTADLERDRAVTYGASPEPEKQVIPLPVDAPSRDARGDSFRERYKIPKAALVVLFLSRLDAKKGLDLLIQAFANLASKDERLVLAVVGEGDPSVRAQCEALATDLGIEKRVRWCGFLTGSDKAAAYCESDLFVLPSRYENFALVVVEAMYCGLPVLTTTGVFIAKDLSEAGAALVCAPTVDDLRKGLAVMISDKAGRAAIGASGKRMANEKYSRGAVAAHYRSLYRSVVAS